MISNKRTIALSSVAVVAAMVLATAGPILADMIQAHAFGGWGFHRPFGFGRFGGFGGFGFPGWGWGGGWGGCGGCCGGCGCGGWGGGWGGW